MPRTEDDQCVSCDKPIKVHGHWWRSMKSVWGLAITAPICDSKDCRAYVREHPREVAHRLRYRLARVAS